VHVRFLCRCTGEIRYTMWYTHHLSNLTRAGCLLSEVNSSLNNAIICHNTRDTEHIASYACWRYRLVIFQPPSSPAFDCRPSVDEEASSRLLSAGGRFPPLTVRERRRVRGKLGRSRLRPTSSRPRVCSQYRRTADKSVKLFYVTQRQALLAVVPPPHMASGVYALSRPKTDTHRGQRERTARFPLTEEREE